MSAFFQCRRIVKCYGTHKVLADISLDFQRDAITMLLGISGCGKTTLLHILAGFIKPDSGSVLLRGVPCTGPGPDRGVIFQASALFPWLTAEENVRLALTSRGVPKKEAVERAAAWLQQVGLAEYGGRRPSQLSGGQCQRVALARVLAIEPEIVLMDEPFAALDAITREQMQGLLCALQKRLHMTVIMVTHDMAEACLLADYIHVMAPQRGIVHSMTIATPRPRALTDGDTAQNLRTLKAVMRSGTALEHFTCTRANDC